MMVPPDNPKVIIFQAWKPMASYDVGVAQSYRVPVGDQRNFELPPGPEKIIPAMKRQRMAMGDDSV